MVSRPLQTKRLNQHWSPFSITNELHLWPFNQFLYKEGNSTGFCSLHYLTLWQPQVALSEFGLFNVDISQQAAPAGSLAPHRPPVNGNDPRGRTARTAAQEPQHQPGLGALLAGDCQHSKHSQVPIPGQGQGAATAPELLPNINHRGWKVYYLCEDQAWRLQLQCNPPQHSRGQVLPQKY